jgi:protein-S-isoprenylcysteine O-methyltransferase Ste14
MSIAWLNLISLATSGFLFGYLSTMSVMPVTREEKRGEKAWVECKWLRLASFGFATLMIVNTILWVWFPIPELAWSTSLELTTRIGIVLLIGVPCFGICTKAMKDAGEEMNWPLKETKLHGGIYNYIRHPGIVGEMPFYVLIAFILDSGFLTLWMLVYIILYSAINIYYEEKDLEKRFGAAYIDYRDRTGMIIPHRRK